MLEQTYYQKYIEQIEKLNKIELVSIDYEEILKDSTKSLLFESLIFKKMDYIRDLVLSPNWKNNIKELIQYLRRRITETNNLFLKARYSSILTICFKQNENESIEYNSNYLSGLFSEKINFATFNETLFCLFESALSEESKNSVYCVTENSLKDDEIGLDTKRVILHYIANYQGQKIKIYNIPNLLHYCFNILSQTANHIHKKHLILDSIKICSRLMEHDINLEATKRKDLYELLADNEYKFLLTDDVNNILTNHYNHQTIQNIVKWYNLSNNSEKTKIALNELTEIKKKLVFPVLTQELYSDEQKAYVESLREYFMRISPEIFFQGLADNLFNLFPSYATIEAFSKTLDIQDFEQSKLDIFNNVTNIKEEEKEEYLFFLSYDAYLQPLLRFFSDILLDRINIGSLHYNDIKKFLLKNTVFKETFVNMVGFDSCLFDYIENPLKSLFWELKRITQHKKFSLETPLDLFGIKIERILRELLFINNIPCLSVKDNQEKLLLLDKILTYDNFSEIYDNEDIDFLKFVLLSNGRNLRNYAAHGMLDKRFYKTEYGIHCAVLLLLCVLRLATHIKQ